MSADLPPETPERPQPPPPDGGRGRLTRSRSDRMIAGVAGGLGRYLGVDPVIARITLVVLVLFGGAGLLLYLAAVLLVPNEDEVAEGARLGPNERPSGRSIALIVLGVVVLCVVVGPIAFVASTIVVPLLFLVVVGLGVAWLVTGRRPERDAGAVARATLLGLGVTVLLCALALAAFWGAGVGGDTVVAIAVIAAGVAVAVAAFARPARWLVLPALAVAIPAGFVAAAGIDLDGGFGERDYRPSSVAGVQQQYELGAGQMTLDLRDVDFPRGDTRVDLDVGMGEAVVIVSDDLCVMTDAKLGMGQADVFARGSGGVDVDFSDETAAGPAKPRLVLDADIGLGHLDVRKTSPGLNPVEARGPWDRRNWDDDRGVNDACAA